MTPKDEAISGSVTVAFQASPSLVRFAKKASIATKPTLEAMVIHSAEWITIASSVGFVAMLAFLANRTKLGLAWKATVTDPEIASSFGVNIIQVRYLNFFIGSSLAAAREDPMKKFR